MPKRDDFEYATRGVDPPRDIRVWPWLLLAGFLFNALIVVVVLLFKWMRG